MLVLTLATEFSVPVRDAQVVVHHGVTVRAVLQNSVKEGLQRLKTEQISTFSSSDFHLLLHFSPRAELNAGDFLLK